MPDATSPAEIRVLVVDDVPANIAVLRDDLESEGYRVYAATSGEAALRVAGNTAPDAILLDVSMPGLDGYETCRRLQSDAATRPIPVLFLTAHTETDAVVAGFRAGGVDYIAKPFRREEVLARLRTHLETARLARELQARTEELERQVTEREAAQAEAVRANAAKSQFLANMSHEIRTPMNAILGYAQILLGQEGLSDAQRSAAAAIDTSGRHLLELINDILDISKIEAGREELHATDFDLGGLLRDLSVMFSVRCDQKSLAWHLEGGDVGRVRGDAGKLRQVLINLLGNAVKFTDAGRVTLAVHADSDRIRFAVGDTGPGIPRERQAAIFEPFQQEAEGLAQGGTGLGLAIARRHVRLMGGDLTLESTLGQGACFAFVLPLEPVTDGGAAAAPRGVVSLASSAPVRALVVDDVAANREVLGQLLSAGGVEARLAGSGPEALQRAAEACPDIVFMDIRMPGMDGPETRRRLLAAHGPERMKVVAVSASVFDHQRQMLLDEGFDAFLDKPLRQEQILACTARLLGLSLDERPTAASSPPAAPAADAGDADAWAGVVIPVELRTRMRDAIHVHSVSGLRGALADVAALGGPAADLARHLQSLLRRFELTTIEQVLEELPGAVPPTEASS